jgi:hypothetical protein
MSWLLKGSLCLTIILAFHLGMLTTAESANKTGKLESKSDPDPAILSLTIKVYNQAHVEDAVLRKAKKEAGRIFGELGISTEWLDCPLTSDQLPNSPVCQQIGFAVLSLRIFPRLEPIRGGFRKTNMGVALVEEQGRVYASVFYQRVVEVVESGRVSTGKVLGHAIAHGIGHLLLGSNSHSMAGLMKARWNEGDLKLLDIGRLHFSPKEGSVMRADVVSRNSEAHNQLQSAAR